MKRCLRPDCPGAASRGVFCDDCYTRCKRTEAEANERRRHARGPSPQVYHRDGRKHLTSMPCPLPGCGTHEGSTAP